MSDAVDFPVAWARAPLSALADINQRLFCSLPGSSEQPVHFIPMSAVSADFGGVDVTQHRPLSEVQKGYTSCIHNDVLFAKITPCMENGKLAVVPQLPNHIAFGSTEFHVLSAKDCVHPKWLAYFISQTSFRRLARQNMTGSAGQMRVPASWLLAAVFPVAPAKEQTRIVAKLEELLSELDAGVAELKAAQKKLARYRQSLLKAAVEGALTAEWRQQNTPAETGAQLLERILVERRARWEAKQIARFKEQGKTPPTDWQNKYAEPVKPDTSNAPELPEGWVWASVDQLTEFITSGSRGWAEFYSDSGATFIRSQDINKDRLELSEVAFVDPPSGSEGARTRVQRDDVLLTITGANVGRSARVGIDIGEAYVSQHVALLRLIEVGLSEYLHLFLTAEVGGRRQLHKEAYGAGKPGLNLQQVGAVPIPLAGLLEVRLMLDAVATQLEAGTDSFAATAISLKQSTAQRQNILRAAFAGQLVPQDPNDEPASVLLERIRAQRAAAEQSSSPRNARASKVKA